MNVSSLLLAIVNKLDGERTIYAGLHLLRGKRSGQTLQDVEYYKLKTFFGILPRLSTPIFDEAADHLVKAHLIFIDDASLVHMTEAGRSAVKELPAYRFNGWDYRGREAIFFARLSLIVQTISNFKAGSTNFIPAQRDAEVQLFVRRILRGKPINDITYSRYIKDELTYLIERSGLVEIQKTIFTHRLVGYKSTGWTWNQLAERLDTTPIAIQLYFIESLHLILDAIGKTEVAPFLKELAGDIKVQSHLTDSSLKTKFLFEKGMSMEEIGASRQLKMSTIEDHFVEMVINDPSFPLAQFVSKEDLEAVSKKSNELGTKRLRLLKDSFPQLTYFQLRLILGAESKGVTKWTSNQS